MIGSILGFVIWLYLAILTVRALLSLVPLLIRDWQPRGALLVVAEFVYTLTDPPLRWLRRLLPPLRIGGAQWDVAFLVLFLVLSVALRVVPAVL
ncbi:MAG: YggT family protein [Propionicimonas sp.]|nr:YggT family protein [Propionicimonas sp.]